MLGSGFQEASIVRGVDEGAAMIGCDSGTTDFGPHPLATGRSQFSRAAVARDLDVMLVHARRAGIPLLIGSAGGSGADPNLAWLEDILLQLAAERSLHFRLATIHAEQSRDDVRRLHREGRIRPLPPMEELSDEAIDSSLHIVAMMGVEPFQQ